MKFKKHFLLFFLLLATGSLYAQLHIVKGRVLNEKDLPVQGATVTEAANNKNRKLTDDNGRFSISLKDTAAVLLISSVNYLKYSFQPGRNTNVVINLTLDNKGLDEVVVVGFGRQTRITNTGSISSVKAQEIKSIPTASVQNALVGRLPGFFSQQRSGQPGSDAADFYIRGVNSLNGDNQPLIIVDDIEYTYAQVSQMNVNEIETISILKDASTTAIYGVKGANGVLVITTNRGITGKPRINATAEAGLDKVIRLPTYLDSYSTALLMNEATLNDSYGLSTPLTQPWTAADLQKFKDGSDPYGHPNVNWNDVLLRKSTTQNRYNVDVSGGSKAVKYFTSLGYFTQNGLLKHFAPTNAADDVDNNYYYRRVNFRSNLDITPTQTLKLRFDINGRFETVNNPGGVLDAAGLFKELQAFRMFAPFVMPMTNPDGSYGYASQSWGNGYANPITRLANGGYKRNFNNNFNIVVGADQKLDFITKGLSTKVNVSYASNINEHRNLTRDVGSLPVFYYNSAANTYTIKNAANYKLPTYGLNTGNDAFNNTTIVQASVNYDHTFGVHHIYALGLLNQNSFVTGGNVPLNYRGLTLRAGYDFRKKYLIEFDLGRNGNDLFRKDQRYGVFPAVSAGWNIAEEHFFHTLLPMVDLFKIRGSYGLVGSDKSYASTVTNAIQYSTSGGITFGNGTNEGGLVNPYITWEKERKTNIGLDVNMYNGKISLTVDYFYNYRYDQLISQGDVPLLIGQSLPKKNMGITENRGVDGIITYKNKIGQLDYSLSANLSYAVNKVVYVSEAPDYPYQAQTGRQLGLTVGYHNLGFYQVSDFDAGGVAKSGVAIPLWSTIQPGDLRYADLNGDGVITTADQTWLSRPNLPTTTYGVNLSLNYKGFSLRTLVQGALGYSVQINAEGADAFNSNLRPWHLERWTPATAATATYPRIGMNTNINNISWQTVSDFWFVNAGYVRLKSLELGYQLPAQWLKKVVFLNSARIYMAGYNLATFRKMGRFEVDPEIASGQGQAYPNMANYTLGIQLGL
jgi:TonB-linked SusC/RagA family outer membrane protein